MMPEKALRPAGFGPLQLDALQYRAGAACGKNCPTAFIVVTGKVSSLQT